MSSERFRNVSQCSYNYAIDPPLNSASRVSEIGMVIFGSKPVELRKQRAGRPPGLMVRRLHSELNASARLIYHLRCSDYITNALAVRYPPTAWPRAHPLQDRRVDSQCVTRERSTILRTILTALPVCWCHLPNSELSAASHFRWPVHKSATIFLTKSRRRRCCWFSTCVWRPICLGNLIRT
jgi:hypothetical protein